METITSKRLKETMGKMSLNQFGALVGIGSSTLYNYIHGRMPNGEMLKQICAKTGTDANWLLGLTDKKDENIELKLNMVKMELGATINGMATLLKRLGVGYERYEKQPKEGARVIKEAKKAAESVNDKSPDVQMTPE